MKTRKITTAYSVQPTNALTHNKALLIKTSLAGLILCSASVAVQAASPQTLNKPAYTLKIVTHGEDSHYSDNMSEAARKQNRRTDVRIQTQVQAGTKTVSEESSEVVQVKVASSNNRSVRLDDGGVIWVSKDPASLVPTLSIVSRNNVAIQDGKFVNPISFKIKSNYSHFIDSWELSVFQADNESKPIATFMGRSLDNGRTIKWNGQTNTGKQLKSGDKLSYVLTVKDTSGHQDKTQEQQITLKGAGSQLNKDLKSDRKLDTIPASNFDNDLASQTIPVHGSRVRIFGRDIATGNTIKINNNTINLVDGKFVIEQLLPEGQHNFDIAISDTANNAYHKALDVDVKGKYMFMVALADVTVGQGKVTGNLESLSDGDKHLDGDIFVDGRLAFYLKGKIQGKYLLTAQMDTGTAEIKNLFNDIHKKDSRSLFRRLDPDKYYPVYGDDSTIIDDTNSQGKMFVRVDWDKSRAIWGNYHTDMTGTELSSFNRSLYGAKLNHKSTGVTKDGKHKTDLTIFASEAQSAFRHNQFLGTGGSLYYLKDNDVVKGSEKIWVEIRQRDSDRAVKKIVMEEGRDYEIDDFQGRIILHRPLLQIAEQNIPSLIKDTPLDGNQVYLMVDYEYVPDSFKSNKATYGGRGKVWAGNHVALGGTYVHEKRDSDDYALKGADITLQKAPGTYIKAEYAQSESTQTQGSFLSDDGGLNFDAFNDNSAPSDIKGDAYSLEVRANLTEFFKRSGSIGAWYKNRDAGFSTSNLNNGIDTQDAGLEAIVSVLDDLELSMRTTLLDKKDTKKTTTASIQADYKVTDKLTVSGEVRHVKEDDKTVANKDSKATLGAFKVGYDLNKNVNLYTIAQGTIKKSGNYADNNLFTLGTKAKLSNKLDLNAEISTGDRGDSAKVGVNYRVSDGYNLYTNYTLSSDRTDNKRSTFTIGQKKSVTDQLKVYTEHQFTHENKQSGVGHTFGLDYQVNKELTANTSVQVARLDKHNGGLTDRDAFSVGLNYKKERTSASTRLEYRNDKSDVERTEQWVTTNRINYRLSPSVRIQGKFNYSETKDKRGNTLDARFTEAALGFALRPVNNDRLNILGRLTYLYDLQPLSQGSKPDEQSLIASLEASYQLDQKWELGGKLAHKNGQIRKDRNSGDWDENDATLAAARVRYHLTKKWDAMAEYHWMNSDQSKDSQHGAMVSIDRHIGKNMKLGVGYNFTNFTDDLMDTDGTAKGWFINLVGKY